MVAEALQATAHERVGLGEWCLGVAPVVLLLLLVASGRVRTTPAALLTLLSAVLIAVVGFDSPFADLMVGVGKGAWTALWILGVVWTALLLHGVCRQMGIDRLGGALSAILPRRSQSLLVVAWVFPSFIQGVAGFGTPIAVAAPLLVSMGVRPVLAVALPLIGYHWSVGFGSVGSSFYMGALTAQLTATQIGQFAAAASLMLGVNAVLAGVLVALMSGGRRALRETWPLLLTVGPAMAGVQALVVRAEPGIGALAGGAAGLVTVAVAAALTRARGRAAVVDQPVTAGVGGGATVDGGAPSAAASPDTRAPDPSFGRLAMVLLPYGLLLVGVLAMLLPPAARHWARSTLTWGPSFPATAGGGPVAGYQPISLFAHPGTFIVLAALLAVLVWRLAGQWPRQALRRVARSWLSQAVKASWSVLLLVCAATVMASTGMVRVVALGIAEATGPVYPALAGLVGALGSFITGSTTSSNALFSVLQAQVADLTGVPAAVLLAAQLAGGNVGNAVAPVVMLLGATAVGARDQLRQVFQAVWAPAAVLLGSVVLVTAGVTWLS